MKKLLLAILFTGVFMSNASANEKLEWKEIGGEVFYQSEIKIREGFVAKVDLNGVTITSSNGDGIKSSSAVPHYIINKGQNNIKISIAGAENNPTDGEADIEILFHAAPKDSIPDESTVVARYTLENWQSYGSPSTISLDFNVQNAPPNGIAVPTPVASLTSDDEAKIKELLQYIISAIKAEDADAYFEVMKYSIESSRAKFYKEFDEEKERASTKRTMKFISKIKDADFDFSKLSLVKVNEGKYYVAQGEKNRPFVFKYNKEAGTGSGVNLAFSKASNGAWYVSSTVISVKETPKMKPKNFPKPEEAQQRRGGGSVAPHVPDSNASYQKEYDYLLAHYSSVMPAADAKNVVDNTIKALDGQTDEVKKMSLKGMVDQIEKMK